MGVVPTFRAFLTHEGLDQRTLSVAEVDTMWQVYDQFVWGRVKETRNAASSAGLSLGTLNHVMAEQVIKDHLGSEWLERKVTNKLNGQAQGGYFDLGEHRLLRVLSLYRVQELARRLYQLQSYPWFDEVVQGVRTRELSGAAFELDMLWILLTASLHVKAKKSGGTKGADYDAFALMGERFVPIEAKAKDDATPWSTRSVVNTVRGAAKQLPKNDTGLLFLRIPTAWVGPKLEEDYADALAEGTQNTSRIGAIISVIDKPHLKGETAGNVTRHLSFFATPDCPEDIWSFCMQLREQWDAQINFTAPPPPF